MAVWPQITDDRLLARLALDDAGFDAFMAALMGGAPPRAYDPSMLPRALGYPWERPAGSYVLRAGVATRLDDLGAGERAEVVAAFTRGRTPLIAIGSNGAPVSLLAKLAHLEERDVLVLTGRLHDLDVGVIPIVTLYGSMPATLFESPGTALGVSVVWLTSEQLTAITWAEIGYRIGRLERARFEVDGDEAALDGVFAYVARLGAYCPDGEPLALAAAPARGRTALALTQEQLLDRVAPLLVGPGARAEDVVRLACEDTLTLVGRAREHLIPHGRPLPPERVTLMPATPASAISPGEAAAATGQALQGCSRRARRLVLRSGRPLVMSGMDRRVRTFGDGPARTGRTRRAVAGRRGRRGARIWQRTSGTVH